MKKTGKPFMGGLEPIAFPLPPEGLLSEGLLRLGLPQEDTPELRGIPSLIPLINTYMRELDLFNSAFDLVGADTRSDLVVRHILDSLAPWKEIRRELDTRASTGTGASTGADAPLMADAGSGAGFPGLPLAMLFKNTRITLIERMSKRCAFLENCAAILRLSNVTVLNAEVEKAPKGAYDLVVFRAFRPLDPQMLGTLLGLLAPGGILGAYKARREKITEEISGLEGKFVDCAVYQTPVPFMEKEERHLVCIR